MKFCLPDSFYAPIRSYTFSWLLLQASIHLKNNQA